jgi:ComEC/Rec2-related protein
MSLTRLHHKYDDYVYPKKQSIIATGIIVEKNIEKYTIMLEDWSYWIYQSKKSYELWDKLITFAKYQAWYTSNIRNRGRKKITITPPSIINTQWEYNFDYSKYQLMKWIQGTLYEGQGIMLQKDQWWMILKYKKYLQHLITDTYGLNKISALILGMLIGDKSLLTKSDYQQFINTGIVHIIAVSWWNIAILSWFLMIILFFLPYYVRISVIAIIIIWYCLICGMDSSVIRAMIMWLLTIAALFMGKKSNIWNILGITWIGMLIYNPYFLIYDIGFWFSFGAVAGIIAIWKLYTFPKNRRWLLLSNTVVPTIWATIWVMPFMMFFIGKFNIIGIIGNLFIIPIVSIVMIYAYISCYLYQWFWFSWVKIPTLWMIKYIYIVSSIINNYSITIIFTTRRMRLIGLIIMLILVILYQKKADVTLENK